MPLQFNLIIVIYKKVGLLRSAPACKKLWVHLERPGAAGASHTFMGHLEHMVGRIQKTETNTMVVRDLHGIA